MQITRHYLTVDGRTVHYRRCGSGPTLLMVHQSPRSSAEYEPLMREWGAYFTCVAPDTPGFGQSVPLAPKMDGTDPDINDYADAVADFVHALGPEKVAAYGFHSGGIILVTALKRHPELFHGLAVGGYAIWTDEEMALFGTSYLPPFNPSAYGEHLTWLWNRILEQSWFFPWFDVRSESRLSVAHADPARVHAVVMEMLDAGDAYRLGYGAVLRAPRDIPPPDAVTPPVVITAYDGDPLQAHIDRLGAMPMGWEARKVATPKEHQEASLAFLQALTADGEQALAEDEDKGFVPIKTADFEGLIHWHGQRGGLLHIHAPGEELNTSEPLGIDLPGHGLSSGWSDATPTGWHAWQSVIDASATALGASQIVYTEPEEGDADRLFPDLMFDRFGNYLITAWGIVRARRLFSPWYEAAAAGVIDFDPAALAPQALAKDHRALIRAVAAKHYHLALQKRERN